MHTRISASTRPLAILAAALLFQSQLAFGDGCSLPMFGGARLFPAASDSQMFAIGDFNGDGISDVAVANGGAAGVSVLLANGDGTFKAPLNYAMNLPSGSYIVKADFNGDGKLDLAVANGSVVVMLGNGDGTFQKGIVNNASTSQIAVGDLNGDGKPDLVFTSGPAGVLLGKGDGTFQAAIYPPTLGGTALFGIATGDFNGDGKLDVIGGTGSGFALYLGDGTGKIANPVAINAGTSFLPDRIAVADLNGDKKLDLVRVTGLHKRISVLLGNGNGTFQAATGYDIFDLANGIAIADLNGDGVPDLAVNSHMSFTAPGTISIFAGVGDGTFQPPVHYNPTIQPNWAMAAGDFNGDGFPDLVFTSLISGVPTQVGLLFGNGDGTFHAPHAVASIGQQNALPRTPVLADFNGDGVPDMAVPNAGINGKLAVFPGNPDGTFQDPMTLDTAFGAKSVALGDMNGDGLPDLVVANGSASNLLVFLSNGDGTFQPPKASGGFFLTTYVVLGDFNGDGTLDAAVRGIGGAQVVLGNGDGTFRSGVGTFGPPIGTCLGCAQGPIATADLNGDGKPDLVMVNGDSDTGGTFGNVGTITVLIGKGDGTFLAPVNYTIGGNASAVAIADLNGDGIPDLAVADSGGSTGGTTDPKAVGALAVLIGMGDGTFQKAVRYPSGLGASWVLAGDFDGDGLNDVAVLARGSKTVTVYLGAGDGTLRNVIAYGSGAADPVGMALADLNADGMPDLLIGDQGTGTVLILRNTFIPGTTAVACAPVPALLN